VDLVITAEGFKSNEMNKFYDKAKEYVDKMVKRETIKEHISAWNIYFLALPSNESGADGFLSKDDTKDTRYDARYWCGGTERLLCVNTSKVFSDISKYVPQYDEAMVIVNATKHGGAGYSHLATLSLSGGAENTMVHELGHSYAGLADEYSYGRTTPPSSEPRQKNITIETNPSSVKWKHLFNRDSSNVVINSGTGATVGLFEGAQYVKTGVYRPTKSSIMQSLYAPFYSVNAEQWAISIYKYLDPIYKSFPTANSVSMMHGTQKWFAVEPYFSTNRHDISWFVDGKSVSSSSADDFALLFDASSKGSHTIKATVSDATGLIFKDDAKHSQMSKTWNISVN